MEPGTVSQPAEPAVTPAGGTAKGTASRSEGYDAAIARVVESAQRLGIDIDRHEAEEWVSAMENEEAGGDLVVDVNTGVYGYRVTMLDFAPADLARFRDMGKIVGFEDRPPNVLTALSISGSAAQSKINAFPADCDFFQRINIKADTREEACAILADMIREKALATAQRAGPSAVGGQVRPASGRGDQGRQAGRRQVADVLDSRRGSRRPDGGRADGRLEGRLHVGRRDPRPRLVQARLGHRRLVARQAGQRQQRPRHDLGGAGREDRAARRLPGPVLPGGLPRRRLDPDLLEAGEGAIGRHGRRIRRDARARGLEVHGASIRATARSPGACTTSSE